jgi:cytochrome c
MRATSALILMLAATPVVAQDVKPSDVVRPAGPLRATAAKAELLSRGRTLFSDTKLSSNELSCASCHTGFEAYNQTFRKAYPHFVQMTKDVGGLDSVNAETMVQFCMVVPMAAKPLPWDSMELAALTAYVENQQADFSKLPQK